MMMAGIGWMSLQWRLMVDEDDCVMKAKMAVQIKVVCKYGIYKDVAAWTSRSTEMELTREG